MSILEKIANGEQFSVVGQIDFFRKMLKVDDLCSEYNNIPSIDIKERKDFIRNLFGETKRPRTNLFHILS